MKQNNLKTVLNSIQDSIVKIDSKAASILTAIGIVFGLSTSLIEPMFHKTTMDVIQVLSFISGSLYLLSSSVCIFFLVLTIFPRYKSGKHTRNTFYNEYYIDVYNHLDDYAFLSKEPNNEQIYDQIKVCSSIAKKKNTFIRTAIIFSLISIFFLVTTILFVSLTVANPVPIINS